VYTRVVRRLFTTVAFGLTIYAVANATPVKVAFDGLFHAKATWRLPCIASHGDGRDSHPVGDLVCTIDAASRVGVTARAHLRCAGLSDVDEGTFAPRTLVATAEALWSVDDPMEEDAPALTLTDIVRQPPLLAAQPKEGVRRKNTGDQGSCCDGPTAASPCKPCPSDYTGVEYTTSQFEKSWCVRVRPWGTGGAPSATVFCVSRDGALTGVSGFGGDMTRSLRCGRTLDPKSS
jgi:hypothetical protein